MKNIPEFKIRHDKNYNLFLNSNEIEEHASEFLKQYSKNCDYSFLIPQATPIESIIELYCDIPMDFVSFSDSQVLGMTVFTDGYIKVLKDSKVVKSYVKKNTIIIDDELASDKMQRGRYNFTLAHELGHVVYHTKLLGSDNLYEKSLFDDEQPREFKAFTCHRDTIENFGADSNKNWTEWQADYFASCLLMPRESVCEFFKPFLKDEEDFELLAYYKPLLAHLSDDELNEKFMEFVKTFKVSRQAARIRLEKLKFIAKGAKLK